MLTDVFAKSGGLSLAGVLQDFLHRVEAQERRGAPQTIVRNAVCQNQTGERGGLGHDLPRFRDRSTHAVENVRSQPLE
jgi:hypothetical protein